MAPVFGDFLAQAHGHVAAAVSIPQELPDTAKSGAIRELDHLVTTLARYLADIPLPGEFHPGTAGGGSAHGTRVVLDARIALRRSAQVLHSAAAPLNETRAGHTHPAAWHLARAAGQLAAGRDLLHTHFASDPSTGTRARASSWANVIRSQPVTDALLSEVGSLAAELAPWMMRLSLESPPDSVMPATAGLALHDASRWVWTAALKLETRSRQQPPAGDGRLLLAAIPANLPPAYRPVAGTETMPDLCAGVLTTAARLQYAAAAFARTARWSAQATSMSWRRDALACAITADSSEVILRGLAQRAAALNLGPATQAHLDNSARALKLACTAWRAITGEWGLLSTGITRGAGVSPVAAEIDDLVLRIGRLAYANPGWTPACSHTSLARDPAALAPGAGDLLTVLTSVHHAADTLTQVAAADAQCVRRAAADHRLYIATRLLPAGCDIPRPYAPAPSSRVTALLDGYRLAVRTCTAATAALDDLAVAARSPSRVLAAAHNLPPVAQPGQAALPAQLPAEADQQLEYVSRGQLPAAPAQPGRMEEAVRDLQLSEPALLLRAAAIDEAARDLLAEATAKAHHQTVSHEPDYPMPSPRPTGRRP